jgi:hypothetical protein
MICYWIRSSTSQSLSLLTVISCTTNLKTHACALTGYDSNFASLSNPFALPLSVSLFVVRFGLVLLILLSPGDNSCIVLFSSVPQITGDPCLPHWILTTVHYWISDHCQLYTSEYKTVPTIYVLSATAFIF